MILFWMLMVAAKPSTVSRRLMIALLVFGLFVLFDIALFSWLIFRSLSEREIQKILLETKGEATTLAERLADRAQQEGGDLFTAVALERETQTYIDSVLRERQIVQTVEIRDKQGRLVFRSDSETTIPVLPQDASELASPEVGSPEVPPNIEEKEDNQTFEVQAGDIEVPIGDLGSIQIGISPAELGQRIEVLRRDLVRQASAVGGVTLLLLFTGYLGVWLLMRRARRLEEQAQEAERMAYVGTLASGLAHEIRNPLNSLNLNMQLLQEELQEARAAPSGPRLLALTRSEINRLEHLVTDFLSYARPRPLDLEEVAPVELLEHVQAVLAPEIERRNARVRIDDRSGGSRLWVDVAQIRQLLLNLTQNALAATEDSGRPPGLQLAAYRQGQQIVLEVVDNGVGIPREAQARIFDIFYSTRKGGTGLGLAIVQRIAKDHGGRLEVRSTEGVGTTVSVYLPMAQGSDMPAHEPVPLGRPT